MPTGWWPAESACKIPPAGGLNNRHCVFTVWGPKVQDQGAGRLMKSFPGLQTAAFSLHPPVDLTLGTVRTCSLMRTPDLLAHGPTLRPSFNLNYLRRGPVSKDTHVRVLGAQHSVHAPGGVRTGEQSAPTHLCSQRIVVVECGTL